MKVREISEDFVLVFWWNFATGTVELSIAKIILPPLFKMTGGLY
jgi:hypothetical protein